MSRRILMFNKKHQTHSDEWVQSLIDASSDAVKAYEEYLMDRITYNSLAKTMKRVHNVLNLLPPSDYPKAKRIENRDYKDYFE